MSNSWRLAASRARLQNPNLVKNMPTYDFAGNNFKKSKLVFVSGYAASGSLGLMKFFHPEKDNPHQLRTRQTRSSIYRRLGAFKASDKVTDVACGFGFTIVAAEANTSESTAFGFGLNTHSQIGYHYSRPGYPLEIVYSPSPIILPTKEPIKKVSCGRSHSLLLDKSGRVFTLGNNSLGQCGRPVDENEVYMSSKMVHALDEDLPRNIVQIECGQDHNLFVTDDGKVYSNGWGADGQTGLGHYDVEWKPTQVRGDLEGAKIVKVSSRADTALALDADGNLFGWGNAEYSQFGLLLSDESKQFNVPRKLAIRNVPGKIVDIAAGGTICALLNDKGHVYVWGFGIIGKGPNIDQTSSPTLIPETLFGMNLYNQDVKVESITAGISQLSAITNRGDLFSWGKNRGNLLGFAHGKDQYFPFYVNMSMASVKKISLGFDHSCTLVEKVC